MRNLIYAKSFFLLSKNGRPFIRSTIHAREHANRVETDFISLSWMCQRIREFKYHKTICYFFKYFAFVKEFKDLLNFCSYPVILLWIVWKFFKRAFLSSILTNAKRTWNFLWNLYIYRDLARDLEARKGSRTVEKKFDVFSRAWCFLHF